MIFFGLWTSVCASSQERVRITRLPRGQGVGVLATVFVLLFWLTSGGARAQSTDPCPCSETKECPKPAGSVTSSGSSAHFPVKPIRLIVPFPPGGTTDAQARLVASQLTLRNGLPVMVENRPGAGGLLGTAEVARADSDGYTLLVTSVGAHIVAPLVEHKVPFDSTSDFAPVASLFGIPYVLLAHPSLQAKTTRELIALLKSQPEKVTFASSGMATMDHLAGVAFQQLTGTKAKHIPYKGGGPASNDLLAGQVQLMFTALPEAVPLVNSGKVHALGVTSSRRAHELPSVPTFDEAGLGGLVVTRWTGVFAPAATPGNVIARLNADINAVLNSSEITSRKLDPCPQSESAFRGLVLESNRKWKTLLKQANIKAN